MLDRTQRFLFTFRPYVLSFIGALTLYAGFQASRLVHGGANDIAPAAGTPAAAAAQVYDTAFADEKTLGVVLIAHGAERIDGAAGAAFRAALKEALAALRDTKTGGPALRENAPAAFHAARDGTRAILELPLTPRAAPSETALGEILAMVTREAGGGSFEAVPLPPAQAPGPALFTSWEGPLWMAASAGAIALGLLAYSGSFVLTGIAVATAALAILWLAGLWSALGGTLSGGMRLIPGLIFALAAGHAFPFARRFMRQLAGGADGESAAADTVRRLAPAGAAALMGTSLALAAAALTPVPQLRETALFAALGALLLFPAVFVVLPLMLAKSSVDRPPDSVTPPAGPPARGAPRNLPRGAPETVAILSLALMVVAGLEAQARSFGPYQAGREDQKKENAQNALANALAADPGSPNAMIAVLARTTPERCTDFEVLDAVDQLAWRLANLPGIARVEALPDALRAANAAAHDGQPAWRAVPRERIAALQAMAALPAGAGLVSADCDLLPLRVYVGAPVGETLERVAATVNGFAAHANIEGLSFALAGGPLAGVLAQAEALQSRETAVLFTALTAVAACLLFALADARALAATALTGGALLLAAGWTLAATPIGLTAQTAPLALFAMLLPADLTAYALAATRDAPPLRREGEEWRVLWRRDAKAFLARSATMVCAFALWLLSPDSVQADCARLVIACTVTGAVATLAVLPAAVILLGRCAKAMRA